MGPQAYMLKANEELFEKTLIPLVEDILKYGSCHLSLYSCVRRAHNVPQERRRDR